MEPGTGTLYTLTQQADPAHLRAELTQWQARAEVREAVLDEVYGRLFSDDDDKDPEE